MDSLWQNVGNGIRLFCGNPGFRAVTAFGIALGFASFGQAAASVTTVPFGNGGSSSPFSIEGRGATEAGDYRLAQIQSISLGYFRQLRIPVLNGREFNDRDGADTLRVAVISSSLAELYFPGECPLGRRIKIGLPSSPNPWMTIVGIVGDVRHDPFGREPAPTIYRPYWQVPRPFSYFVRGEEGNLGIQEFKNPGMNQVAPSGSLNPSRSISFAIPGDFLFWW
jgi:hypothetical protein